MLLYRIQYLLKYFLQLWIIIIILKCMQISYNLTDIRLMTYKLFILYL